MKHGCGTPEPLSLYIGCSLTVTLPAAVSTAWIVAVRPLGGFTSTRVPTGGKTEGAPTPPPAAHASAAVTHGPVEEHSPYASQSGGPRMLSAW